MRAKINMDTTKAAETVAHLASNCETEVFLEDGNGLKVRARSILGCLHALEFSELWLTSDEDYYSVFQDFIVGSPLDPPAAF